MSIDEGRLQFPNVPKKEMLLDLKKHKKERKIGFLKELKATKRNLWYFIKVENKIAGFIHAQINKNDKKFAELEKVYILKEFRGKGLAVKLCKFIFRLLKKKGVKKIQSGIFALNKPSIRLHEYLGFKPYSVKLRKVL
ncbi:MAG: GNAT family N-acetyltransferase [Candidatus Nanoarchaeia archaeon]|nr:GNAT family N-acetyltransferase [Candidatus Nanoarchaeia archaeon]